MTSRTRQTARILAAAMNDNPALRPVSEPIDWDCVERLAAFAAKRKAEMVLARWVQLQKEWEA